MVDLDTKKVDVPMPEILEGDVKRIYIGGVSPGVTVGDMEKTFSSLGSVRGVEFVRTNGRDIAFMDFEPRSDKSLLKLFSTYNGCTWKGGKLKLEMAKEHYLTRLKREWAEAAKLASAKPSANENVDLVTSHCPSKENTQMRIFFPKLRKVKTLPFKGTGKHKYSFQRIEVPSLPIYFCDCEEHSKVAETGSQKCLPSVSTVVHEKEHNMMASVINKILGGDAHDASSLGKMPVASNSNTLTASKQDVSEEIEVASDADPDNLVTNIGVISEDDILKRLRGGMDALMHQESGSCKPQYSKARDSIKKAGFEKRKESEVTSLSSVKPNKRMRPEKADGVSKQEPELSMLQNMSLSSLKSDSTLSSPNISSEDTSQALTVVTKAPTKGCSWVQKSSWKDMVGRPESSSFSISSLVTGVASSKITFPKPHKPDTRQSDSVCMKSNVKADHTARLTTPKNPKVTLSAEVPEKGSQNHPLPKEGKTSDFKQIPTFSFSEVCPFMRSAESEKQWAKARKALSGYVKSNNTKDQAAKFSNGRSSK